MATTSPPLFRALLAGVALLAAACGADDSSTTNTAATDSVGDDSTSTLAGVEAAAWSDNVVIEIDAESFTFVSDGIPSHEVADEYLVPTTGQFTPPVTGDEVSAVSADIAIVESPVDVTIPLVPAYSETTTETNLGIIGVVISGAQLFNDYEDPDRSFVALDDNFSIDGVSFVDACNGHPLALLADGTGAGDYHYHGVPYCITDTIDADGQHSSILGFLLDGFPFYGPHDTDGATITSDDLDECSGHVGPTPEFPDGIYHYHLTEDRSPYTIDCYHGVVDSDTGAGQPVGGPGDDAAAPGAPDFSEAAASLGVSVDELEAALGQPPFDLDAAAEALPVTAAELQAVLPPPPGDAPEPADSDAAAADSTDASDDANEAELALRAAVVERAAWSANVTISIDGATVTFESDGLPSHEYLDTYLGDGPDGKFIAGGVEAYDARFSFPLVPTEADTPTETGDGAIGVAVSGAVFFDPYEGNGSATVANDDNETIDGIPFIDACGGHPLPNAVSYHYHGIPFCITDALDADGQHSALIGYLFDGNPIYGPQDVGGDEPTDLDDCLGHTGPTPDFEDDVYHYHVSSTANCISECYSGVATVQARRP